MSIATTFLAIKNRMADCISHLDEDARGSIIADRYYVKTELGDGQICSEGTKEHGGVAGLYLSASCGDATT